MDLVDSMFSYWQGGIQVAEQGMREAEKKKNAKRNMA